MKDVGRGRFGIEIEDPGKQKPYRVWYRTEISREEAFSRLSTNKKLSIKRIKK